jgi:hypothetical protein
MRELTLRITNRYNGECGSESAMRRSSLRSATKSTSPEDRDSRISRHRGGKADSEPAQRCSTTRNGSTASATPRKRTCRVPVRASNRREDAC